MKRYSDLKILVVGDFMLDKYLEGTPTKISQEAPVLVVKHNYERNILGGAGNVVANLLGLGIQVFAAGCVGNDIEGNQLRDLLLGNGVDVSCLVKDINLETICKTRIVAKGQHMLRYDRESHNKMSQETSILLSKRIIGLVERLKIDAIVVADYDKYVITPSLMDCLRQTKRPIFINGKPENVSCYLDSTFLIVNNFEFEGILENLKISSTVELTKFLRCQGILHTQGDKGIILHQLSGDTLIEAEKVVEIDPTGASDTVVAVFCAEYLRSYNIIDALKLANKAASIIVTKFGTAPISIEELTLKGVEK